MSKVYLDTETCGLHSMMVLLQYAEEDGPIRLHEVWRRPIRETLRLIEWLTEHTVVGFNMAFDWFHVAKTYTVFRLADPDWIPQEHINEIALLEPKGQDGPCVKPACAGPDAPFPQGAVPVPYGPRRHPHQAGAFRAGLRAGCRIGRPRPTGQHLLRPLGRSERAEVAGLRPQGSLRRHRHGLQGCRAQVPCGRWTEVPRRARDGLQTQVSTSRTWSRLRVGGPTSWATPPRRWRCPARSGTGKSGAARRAAPRSTWPWNRS